MSTNLPIDQNTPAKDKSTEISESVFRANIIGNMHVKIIRVSDDISWDHKIHAINWFDSRFLFLYNFYNLIASRSVNRVGGFPLFKGRLLSHIYGESRDRRGVLLIVEYPSPKHFTSMLENTYFKIASIVRAIAVQRFSFLLSHEVFENQIPKISDSISLFAVHQFRGSRMSMMKLLDSLRMANKSAIFSSMKTHELVTVSTSGKSTSVPALMDGIVLFTCTDESSLKALVNSPNYRSAMDNCETSFIGLFERIF